MAVRCVASGGWTCNAPRDNCSFIGTWISSFGEFVSLRKTLFFRGRGWGEGECGRVLEGFYFVLLLLLSLLLGFFLSSFNLFIFLFIISVVLLHLVLVLVLVFVLYFVVLASRQYTYILFPIHRSNPLIPFSFSSVSPLFILHLSFLSLHPSSQPASQSVVSRHVLLQSLIRGSECLQTFPNYNTLPPSVIHLSLRASYHLSPSLTPELTSSCTTSYLLTKGKRRRRRRRGKDKQACKDRKVKALMMMTKSYFRSMAMSGIVVSFVVIIEVRVMWGGRVRGRKGKG